MTERAPTTIVNRTDYQPVLTTLRGEHGIRLTRSDWHRPTTEETMVDLQALDHGALRHPWQRKCRRSDERRSVITATLQIFPPLARGYDNSKYYERAIADVARSRRTIGEVDWNRRAFGNVDQSCHASGKAGWAAEKPPDLSFSLHPQHSQRTTHTHLSHTSRLVPCADGLQHTNPVQVTPLERCFRRKDRTMTHCNLECQSMPLRVTTSFPRLKARIPASKSLDRTWKPPYDVLWVTEHQPELHISVLFPGILSPRRCAPGPLPQSAG